MGLKTENYKTKNGIPLPTAYAKIKDLVLNGNKGRAIFAIHATRDDLNVYAPAETVEVRFTWDRKTNPAEMAYEAAKKETRTYEKYDEETHTAISVTEHGTLYGWKNDIV